MNSHTPQEWADWTGCYVVQSKEGGWYLLSRKPKLDGNNWWGNEEPAIRIDERLVSFSANHDWTTLYEPRKADNAPHQSEVFIHREYALVGGDSQTDLSGKVNVMMNHGWKLQGGVAVEHLPISDGYADDRSFFYQAMVRGL